MVIQKTLILQNNRNLIQLNFNKKYKQLIVKSKRNNSKMNSCKIPRDYQKPIIYYQGSFDPTHEGHLSALETAMKATQATFAVIMIDDVNNPNKPERSSWEVRREIAVRTFGHLENVCISDKPREETKHELLKNPHVIRLIGSDVWPTFSERTKIKFHELCLSARDPKEHSYPTILAGKNVLTITPPILGCSSSLIKNHLKSHPELYEQNALIPPGTILDRLSPFALDFILQNKVYYQSKEDLLNKTKKKIEKYVSEYVFKDKEFTFTCLTENSLDPLYDIKSAGRSGDLTFLASYNGEKLFIKGYVKSSHLENCKNEVGGIELLHHLSLSWAKAVGSIHYKQNDETYSLIAVPYLEQPTLSQVFKSIHSPESEKRFIDMCFYVGRALSELHHNRSYPIRLDKLQEETNVLNERTFARLKKHPPEKQAEFSSIISSSYEDFIKNPGPHTYVHGDANPANFIADEEKGTVYFLDLEHFFLKRSEDGNPLGLPAEDYYRFLENIPWLNEEGSISSSVVISAQEAFEKGYNTLPSHITPEAHRYFSNYWRIRNYKFQKQNPT